MAQITQITSEALQATIRRLLPSQQGFGEDLQASNVITPIIDLTPTAEGSSLSENLSTALAFGSVTAFNVQNTTTTLITNAGFFRVFGAVSLDWNNASSVVTRFRLGNGLTNKNIVDYVALAPADAAQVIPFDFVVYINAGENLSAESTAAGGTLRGNYRQIADVNGNIVNPDGFSPQ